MSYRNASDGHNGSIEMQLIDSLGNATTLNTANFNSTGGWQTWVTTNTSEVFWLDKGIHHIRLVITLQEYNINWFQFDIVASTEKSFLDTEVLVTPNPSSNYIEIILPKNKIIDDVKILDLSGRVIAQSKNKIIDVSYFPTGIYLLHINSEGATFQSKFVKK